MESFNLKTNKSKIRALKQNDINFNKKYLLEDEIGQGPNP
jgi:hypothetical protein